MMQKPPQSNLAGIVLLLAGLGFLTGMDSLAKWLVGADYSALQILALRGWIIIAGMLLVLPRQGGPAVLKTARPVAHVLRVVVGFFSPYLFFLALKTMPLADATVLFFGGSTFLMTALSGPLFNEPVGPHRWAAIGVGFLGVLIAAQPGGTVLRVESLYAIGAGATYALLMVATRWLGRSEGVFRQVFFYNLGIAVIGSATLPFVFKAMPADDLAILAAMAGLAAAGHYCMTRAFSLAPVGLLAPFEYSLLVWAAAFGYIFWGDIPGLNILLGAAVIVVSGLYLAHREALAARAGKSPRGQ